MLEWGSSQTVRMPACGSHTRSISWHFAALFKFVVIPRTNLKVLRFRKRPRTSCFVSLPGLLRWKPICAGFARGPAVAVRCLAECKGFLLRREKEIFKGMTVRPAHSVLETRGRRAKQFDVETASSATPVQLCLEPDHAVHFRCFAAAAVFLGQGPVRDDATVVLHNAHMTSAQIVVEVLARNVIRSLDGTHSCAVSEAQLW